MHITFSDVESVRKQHVEIQDEHEEERFQRELMAIYREAGFNVSE